MSAKKRSGFNTFMPGQLPGQDSIIYMGTHAGRVYLL